MGLAVAAIALLSGQLAIAGRQAAPQSADSPAMAPPAIGSMAPKGGEFELTLHAAARRDPLDLLLSAGADRTDATRLAARLGRGESDVRLLLGAKGVDGRPIIRLVLMTDLGTETYERSGTDFVRTDKPTLIRQRFAAGPQLYWDARRALLDVEDAGRLQQFSDGMEPGTPLKVVLGVREGRFGGRRRAALLFAEGRNRSGSPERGLMLDDGQWLDLERPSAAALMKPVPGRVTSTFGARWHPILQFLRPHRGVDFAAAYGQPVVAAADGTVEAAGWRGGYGRQIRIAHNRIDESSYSHLSSLAVSPGEHVRRGQLIGYAGASGLATGPHLHFEVYSHGVAVNPLGMTLSESDDPLARGDVRARLRQLGVTLG